MKKSKFVFLSMVLILLLCFSLFSVSVEVKAASDGELDVDIEEFWVENGWPLSAMNYEDSYGKGIRFYVDRVDKWELVGTTIRYAIAYSTDDYYFDDGSIDNYIEYVILYQFCSDALVSVFNYYSDTYGLFTGIPEFDKVLIIWDVDQQMFVSSDYLFYQIETSFNEGYDEGQNVGYGEGYDVGYSEGHEAGYDVGYNEGHDVGYSEGYDEGYDIGFEIAQPKMDILLITFIMFIVSVFVYFKFRLRWVLIATTLLWFVPIFLVENLFIKIFSAIMIVATIVITFFNEREEDYE